MACGGHAGHVAQPAGPVGPVVDAVDAAVAAGAAAVAAAAWVGVVCAAQDALLVAGWRQGEAVECVEAQHQDPHATWARHGILQAQVCVLGVHWGDVARQQQGVLHV